MTTEIASRCSSLASAASPPPQQRGHVVSMTSSSPPTSGRDDDGPESDDDAAAAAGRKAEKRLSFGISQILQSDDRRRRDRDVTSGDVISGNGDATTAMALIRSAFGSYVSAVADPVQGLLVPGAAAAGLYGGGPGVIRVPAQRLTGAVCVGQPPPAPTAAAAAAACRLSAMMFPWMRERKDGLTCKYNITHVVAATVQ